jgi:hypothetical protein
VRIVGEERTRIRTEALRARASEKAIERYMSLLIACALSGECQAPLKHAGYLKLLQHRLDAVRYYKQHGVDIHLEKGTTPDVQV